MFHRACLLCGCICIANFKFETTIFQRHLKLFLVFPSPCSIVFVLIANGFVAGVSLPNKWTLWNGRWYLQSKKESYINIFIFKCVYPVGLLLTLISVSFLYFMWNTGPSSALALVGKRPINHRHQLWGGRERRKPCSGYDHVSVCEKSGKIPNQIYPLSLR